jgi:hypothetical protein
MSEVLFLTLYISSRSALTKMIHFNDLSMVRKRRCQSILYAQVCLFHRITRPANGDGGVSFASFSQMEKAGGTATIASPFYQLVT